MNPTSLGQGISWPPRIDGDGRLRLSSDADNVREAIQVILLTEPGERIARPNFGVGLRRYLFAPNSLELRTQIRAAVTDALARDEARIRVESVAVNTDPREPTVLSIAIRYQILDEPGVQNLVFPFYLNGGR